MSQVIRVADNSTSPKESLTAEAEAERPDRAGNHLTNIFPPFLEVILIHLALIFILLT